MKLATKQKLTATTLGLAMASNASAAFITHVLPGASSFDGWDDLTVTNAQVASSSPSFPNISTVTSAWPEAIDSQVAGSGDATFDKSGGGGYPAGANIYTGFATGGTFAIADNTPLANLETVIFQLDLGLGSGEYFAAAPSLTINGSTVVPLFDSGIVQVEDRPGFGGEITVGTFGYQWDLQGLGPITSLEVDFTTGGTSSTIWGAQLNQGQEFTVVPVPEPSSLLFLSLASLGLFRRQRR